ncbi:MAG: 1-deoxy-D-xylulose-5-phosphate reductoisomerase [Candidatus Brocadiaceae bacterium]|jgi:1-deoxy-D-xylulose-5-phosphate reductoisomerase
MAGSAVKNVVILGSTGSVGTQTVDVIRSMPGRFRVLGLSGHSHWELLARQVEELEPEVAVMTDPAGSERLAEALGRRDVQVLSGSEGLVRLATWDGADVVVSAVSGGAGIPAAVATLESGRRLALANKESLVTCGSLLMELARRNSVTILPVDSEHSALFQLLEGLPPESVQRVVLTASGGPFYGRSRAELARVTPQEALQHPTWRMGRKITIDSATLMNKALEIIEARWLFGLPAEAIGVVIHPQSIVHCIVELVDGTSLAHMGAPDMRLPIQYALSYPERTGGAADRLNLAEVGRLDFDEPDVERFPALKLGYRVARQGGTSGAVLSAADEVAVAAFLSDEIGFTDIITVVERTLDRHAVQPVRCVEDALEADRWAREEAKSCLRSL